MRVDVLLCDACGRDASEKPGGRVSLFRVADGEYDLCAHCALGVRQWIEGKGAADNPEYRAALVEMGKGVPERPA